LVSGYDRPSRGLPRVDRRGPHALEHAAGARRLHVWGGRGPRPRGPPRLAVGREGRCRAGDRPV